MANSIITRLSNGSSMQFSLNFTLGILNRADVTARVGNEVDGGGNPVYRGIEWITDGLVNVLGTQAPLNTPVVFTRTVRKDQLVHDYANGTPIEELNLDESNKQCLMAMHEVLDGRFPGGLAQNLNMNGFKVTNMAAATAPHDAVRFDQVGDAQLVAEHIDEVIAIGQDLLGADNIGTVVANIAKIGDVAAIDSQVSTVAGIAGNVTTVAGNTTNINTVASNNSNITTVAGVAGSIPTVAGISGNITTVAGISGNVTTVAGNSANVTTVANNISNVNTVATNITNVNTVATNITDIQNAEENAQASEDARDAALLAQAAAEAARDATLASFDSFDDRYLGAKSSDPTLDNDGNALVSGAIYFNTVAGAMKVYTGSIWVAAYVSGTDFLAKTNNLSDLSNVIAAQQNLDLELGVDVLAYGAFNNSVNGLSIVQGDIIYGSGSNAAARLAKDTSATRYLSNTGASNNPAWAQIDLSNGVTGDLPFANLTQGSALSVLGVTGNATADVASIAAGSDNQVLRRSGTEIGFGAVNLASSSAVTGILAGTNGGTNNGFFQISGPASTTKTYTVPNATCNILTDNAAVTVAQGGTGRATGSTAYGVICAGTTATGAQQTTGPGTSGQVLTSNGASALPTFQTLSALTASSSSISSNGYMKLNNGLILMWGTTSSLTGGGTTTTISFPTSFDHNCWQVLITPKNTVQNGGQAQAHTSSINTSSFDLRNTLSACPFDWFAIGN